SIPFDTVRASPVTTRTTVSPPTSRRQPLPRRVIASRLPDPGVPGPAGVYTPAARAGLMIPAGRAVSLYSGGMKPPLEPAIRSHLRGEGARLLAEGESSRAPEACEDLWKAAPAQRERDLWQGLSQLAAALVKYERGEPATAITLLAKSRSKLEAARLEGDAA